MLQKIKRHINVYLRPKYTKRQLENRSGDCRRCGNCCKIWFRCPFLGNNSSDAYCKIYPVRPKVCRFFPCSGNDLKEVNYECGFYF